MNRTSLKTVLITTLKFAVPLVIIVWLLSTLEPEQMEQLRARSKNWPLLWLAFALIFASICLTFFRWYLLVRGLHLPFRIRDAFRLGFLGYLLNFVSVGSVGGDLFKAFFIAREQPGRRPEAIATVVVDRLVGLYALLVVTSLAILLSDPSNRPPEIVMICNVTLGLSAVGFILLALVLLPGFATGTVSEFLEGLPKAGPVAHRIIEALRMYRRKPVMLLVIAVMSIAVHALLAVALFLLARGLFDSTPTLAEHFVIVPLGMVAGALPFTPGGLGAFELALDKLYIWIPAGDPVASGVLVALAYHVITIAVAGLGIVVYWSSRRTVKQIMQEVEAAEREEEAKSRAAPIQAAEPVAPQRHESAPPAAGDTK